MTHELKIFIKQLQTDHQEKIDLTVSPDFFELSESELIMEAPVSVKGEIYVTDHHLILHLDAKTRAKMPCAICNNLTDLSLEAKIYESLPLSEIEDSLFDYSSFVKEELLLQIPLFAECESNCPERSNLKAFLKKEEPKKSAPHENTHFPFSDL